jgi:hypothetical protein
MLVVFLLMLLLQGAITYAVFQIFMEGGASVGASLWRSFSRIPVLLAMAFLAIAAAIAIMMLPILAAAFIGRSFLTLIVAVAAPVMMIAFLCMWYVAAPVCVVEKTGPLKSFGRSCVLTKGSRLKIFGMALLVGIIMWIISAVVSFIVKRALGPGFAAALILAAANSAPFAFVNIMAAVAYYSLRVGNEHRDAATLADIFD